MTIANESNMEVDEHVSDDVSLDELLKIIQKSMKKDEYWYLVDKLWFDQFEKYIRDREPSNNPGPIDNTNLFNSIKKRTGVVWKLKDELVESDYQFIPEEAWHVIVRIFGVKEEKHIIKRSVIEEGRNISHCIVEVYIIELEIRKSDNTMLSVTMKFSRATTLRELEEKMRAELNVDPSKDTQIYQGDTLLNAHIDTFEETIITPSKVNNYKTLAEASLYSGSTVTLAIRNDDGSWPITRKNASTGFHVPGICGLENLGNTCFMNSALQFLSNTPPLTDFITSDKYLKEINKDNPLGMKGEIATTYGNMIKAMWSGNTNRFSPRDFKYAVGCFAPQFSGHAQQDCQELMAFLLDGLHEDMNRIKKKPYIENGTDVDEREDSIKAKESWESYKKRNDSIIVDTFHGLLKSTLICPDCQLVSVTFDPFCYLSLPMPGNRNRYIDVTFVPAYTKSNNSNANEIRLVSLNDLSIPKYGSIVDIHNAVAKAVNESEILVHTIHPSKLILTEATNHRFNKIYENHEAIVTNMEKLVIFEKIDDTVSIPVYLKVIKSDGSETLFGKPFFVGLKDSQFESIHKAIMEHFNIEIQDSISDESSVDSQHEAEHFSISIVNSFGTMEIQKLNANDPINLTEKSYLAVNLSESMKSKYLEECENYKSHTINMPKIPHHKSSIPLSECIMNFTTIEKLGADDPWYCPACKTHQQATKKFDLWDLPNVLIIHLKRFTYTRYWRDKLDTLIEYPVTGLDMGEYVINNPTKKPMLYDLIAVSNHSGNLGGGHYTAYAKNCRLNSWYFFNDSSVSEVDEKCVERTVVSRQGYVLYYLKRT